MRCTLEVLVVDDGSTDQTPAIVRRFVARDARVRVLRQPHRGAGAARNFAAQAARGNVLAFCDGDMVFLPEYLATLIAPIDTPPVSLKRSVKRAVRHRLPPFLLLKAVIDVGILTGLIEKRLRIAGHGR